MATGKQGQPGAGPGHGGPPPWCPLGGAQGWVEREAAVDGTSAAHQPHATDAGVGPPGEVVYGRVGLGLPPSLASTNLGLGLSITAEPRWARRE